MSVKDRWLGADLRAFRSFHVTDGVLVDPVLQGEESAQVALARRGFGRIAAVNPESGNPFYRGDGMQKWGPGGAKMAEKQQTEIDAGLLEDLRARAREQSRTESDLLEEIVRSYLVVAPRRSGGLNEFFERLERRRHDDGVEPLSEDEATKLANEELHAMRRERGDTL